MHKLYKTTICQFTYANQYQKKTYLHAETEICKERKSVKKTQWQRMKSVANIEYFFSLHKIEKTPH